MDTQTYNYKVVRQFAIMTVVWGIVGMLVGVIVAAQLFAPALDLSDVGPWFHFGRLRPLHTNAVIFAFGGCGLMGTSYYVVQRTCNARLFGGWLPAFTFWGWQAVIVAAIVSLPLGYTQAKEYAELELPTQSYSSVRLPNVKSNISTLPTGSTAVSFWPSPCCTSSIT